MAVKYGYKNGTQLRNEFTSYRDADKRLTLSQDNKKSAKAHLQRYKDILPLLKDTNTAAFDMANADLAKLEKDYNKRY